MSCHYGEIFERIARALPPEAPALVHEGAVTAWGELHRRSNRLARALLAAGLAPGDKVAHYLRNHPAYLETFVACSKARLTHVNVNFRYRHAELRYLLENSDARAVVYAAEFAPLARELARALPAIRLWIEVPDGTARDGAAPAFARHFEVLASEGDAVDLGIERSPDDLHFIYTGGTTGLPKGVMWRHADLWAALGAGGSASLGIPAPPDLETHVRNVAAAGSRPVQMPLNPLMHGAALMTAITALAQGGTVVTLGGRFEPVRALQAIARQRVTAVCIVGDAFARPLLEALDAHPGEFDLRSLKVVVSTGAMWSEPVKAGLLRHAPHLVLYDALGSTESVGYGAAHATGTDRPRTARFRLGPEARVLSADLQPIEPGSATIGYIARCGPVPLGYYKDPERTRHAFPVIDGVRHAIPGDLCRLAADGTVTLLGRGSGCINTGGEKVYAEEVEESLKRHPSVRDAIVIGWPSERWGQAVTAVVELRRGARLDEAALREHVRAELADYKAPKRIVAVPDLRRAPNGKPDYEHLREVAGRALPPSL